MHRPHPDAAAVKTPTFAMNPAVGGMPANDNRKIVMREASNGLRLNNPA